MFTKIIKVITLTTLLAIGLKCKLWTIKVDFDVKITPETFTGLIILKLINILMTLMRNRNNLSDWRLYKTLLLKELIDVVAYFGNVCDVWDVKRTFTLNTNFEWTYSMSISPANEYGSLYIFMCRFLLEYIESDVTVECESNEFHIIIYNCNFTM